MKYIWSIIIGMIATVFALSFYVEGTNISMYILAAMLLAVAVISQVIFSKTKRTEIIIFPIIIMVGIAIFAFVQNVDSIILDEYSITNIVYFVILLVFAIKSRTVEQDGTFGVRTFFALEYKEIWDKTHNFYSIIISGFMPPLFALVFWQHGWIRFWLGSATVLLPGLIAIIYSSIIGSKYHREASSKEAEQLRIQEEIEESGYRRNKKCD